jgi:putative sigma-54 modulation protein
MQIAVTFRHTEADEGIKGYVKGKVQRLQKYIENPREVHVVLSSEKFRHKAEITIIGDRGVLHSQGRDTDLYVAIDQMVEKMERQIRGRHEKVRRKGSHPSLPQNLFQGDESPFPGKEETDIPPIIQRRRTLAKPMSLEEAVAQLQLSKKDFLIFIHSDSGQMNALYRRKDGGLDWVEPRPK